MTYYARQWSAIDAVINAGRDVKPHESATGPHPVSACNERESLGCVDPRAARLLLGILDANSASTKQLCVQFIACGQEISAFAVAVAVSRAATILLGRSLMLNAQIDNDVDENTEARSGETVPDAFLPGLYHYELAHRAADPDLLFDRSRHAGGLTSLLAPFKFVAVNSHAPPISPAGSALAAMCTGTVLVARAGESSRSVIKEVALQVTRAGGRIIGLVLDEAPQKLPTWIRRP